MSHNDNYSVEMLGQIGNDQEGISYKQFLQENNIETKNIQISKFPTGQAYILSQTTDARNTVIIVGGANQAFSENESL